jgi:hypothetical protein
MLLPPYWVIKFILRTDCLGLKSCYILSPKVNMDRRRQERFNIEVPIKIKRYADGEPSTFETSSKDISSTGVFINSSNVQLEAKQKVHLELTLTIEKLKELFGGTSKVTLEVDGVVVRSRDNGVVIEFEDTYSIIPHQSGKKWNRNSTASSSAKEEGKEK